MKSMAHDPRVTDRRNERKAGAWLALMFIAWLIHWAVQLIQTYGGGG